MFNVCVIVVAYKTAYHHMWIWNALVKKNGHILNFPVSVYRFPVTCAFHFSNFPGLIVLGESALPRHRAMIYRFSSSEQD